MKKVMVCIVLGSLLMTSCFSTRYVSAEPGLKKEFRGAWVEDVEFEFGDPGDIED
jgi:hypothetical protein